MSSPHEVSRRGFLRTGLAAGAILGLPAATYRAAFAADEKPSEKIRIGMIGVGAQGKGNLGAVKKNVVALCDVDSKRLADAAKSIDAEKNKFGLFEDYRKLLEDKNIDAVLISTPDHWHALQTVNACEAGKHVYCEKPLTLTIAEG